MNLPAFTLLIVEDFPANRELYRHCLLTDPSCDYQVLEAESVAAGLELCRTQSIDAILLDYALPDANGLEFLEELSQHHDSSPTVVMITGYGNESIAVQAMKLGVRDYLPKRDFTPERLQLTMRSAIENARLRLQLQQSQERLQGSVLALTDRNQQLTTIWESMTDAYVTLDRDWQIIYTNQAANQIFYRLVGLVPDEFLGKTYWEVFPWSVDNFVDREYRRAVTDRVTVHFEVLDEPTGEWFEVNAYPSSAGLGIYLRDITERKRLESVRIQAEQERDRFFNLSIDLLAVGNFDGYFVGLNPAWEKVFGYTPTELMAQPSIDFVHPDDREQTLASAQRLTTGNAAIDFENRYRCQDGSYRRILWSAIPDLARQLWYASGHDITDRQQIQTALEARNQELDSFVYIVSHDLKAPLRAIANLSQWIEDDLAGSLSLANQQQMVLLRTRVERMQNTIDGLLDYARIGRTDGSIESVVVSELLAEVINAVGHTLGTSNAPPPTFTIDIAPNLPTLVTKRLMLSQVFTNLIGNAIEHHDRADGSIQISCQESGNFYEFAIADDGAGIAPEHHDRIFNIFHAVNPQNRSDSTGIGLAIVKKIVEAEGGSIWLESQIGRGTTFYFTWPKR